MPGHKRIAAGIMGILMLFIVLFSAFYIAAEADHDCTGEDCPICACIQQCENTLHQIGDGIASQAAVIISFSCSFPYFLLRPFFHRKRLSQEKSV